ncbi:uncharacterized protein LOC107371459 [Tetranychus urticae]|uniref:NADH dehydrogenase [ubiquinone] 1 beta subcomplex subunit 11, mitochondrial n=1 Tax=Tetranychus urticae TaxID=32264 RepID=T1JWN4_TETUR|nr:uncharacterized protein LOC107371459 [Tetranychus urticae]
MMIPFRLFNTVRLFRRHNLIGTSYNSSVRLIKTGNDGTGGGKASGHDNIPPSIPYGGDGDIYLRPGLQRRPPGPKTVEDFLNPEGEDKNWLSYGCDPISKKHDRYEMHYYAATTIIIFFVWGALISRYYRPDYAPRNILSGPGIVAGRQQWDFWALREAYLEIERREKLGLPYIDPDYIPAEKMLSQLPSEEELALYDYDVYV